MHSMKLLTTNFSISTEPSLPLKSESQRRWKRWVEFGTAKYVPFAVGHSTETPPGPVDAEGEDDDVDVDVGMVNVEVDDFADKADEVALVVSALCVICALWVAELSRCVSTVEKYEEHCYLSILR
jgi:hypothetical protein